MRPMLLALASLNQRLPSGPATINVGWLLLPAGSTGNSFTVPPGVTFAIRPAVFSATHMFPSGPRAIPAGPAPLVRGNSGSIVPAVVSRPTLLAALSVNHRIWPGPAVIPLGPLADVSGVNPV